MISLLVFIYIPALILSDKSFGSFYPALLLIIPSFIYISTKKGIAKLLKYDGIIFDFLQGLFIITAGSFLIILGIILFLGLVWCLWSILLS